jgi:hypothetical protein
MYRKLMKSESLWAKAFNNQNMKIANANNTKQIKSQAHPLKYKTLNKKERQAIQASVKMSSPTNLEYKRMQFI